MTVKLDVREVLIDAWMIYVRNLDRLVAVAAIGFGSVLAITIVTHLAGADISVTVDGEELLVNPVGIVLYVVALPWIQGALAVSARILREDPDGLYLGAIWKRLEPRLWHLLGAGLIQGVVVGALAFPLALRGLPAPLLLGIPLAVFVATWWAVLVPVVALEKLPVVASFRRSHWLVRGNAWRVFWVILIAFATAFFFSVMLKALLSGLPGFLGAYVSGAIASMIVTPWAVAAVTEMYGDLRLAREALPARRPGE
ncbi:MAG: hypothetical protein R3C15_07150 [Thermoleophilia bacterium]